MNKTSSLSRPTRGSTLINKTSSLPVGLIICAGLMAVIWVVYGKTLRNGFVNYDDDSYVYHNFEVTRGLSFDGLVWAFTHSHAAAWQPLSWISHMIDCQIWGLHAGGHHLVNVILHGVGTILLFLVLRAMTQATWRSALVAGLWAIHPLRVESVAWVAERKDVLSGIFFFLTVASYVYYVRKGRSLGRYSLVAVVFALGLMSKPTLVTTPLVLLLLDYWPLGRLRPAITASDEPTRILSVQRPLWLLLEKIPLFALSAGCCVATVWAQKGAISTASALPFGSRLANALTSYVIYLWQTVWPLNLAILYPHPENTLTAAQITLAGCILVFVTTAAIVLLKTRPYFIVGWLWYLGMLVPMIGLVQTGAQARGDHFTYLPHIGITIAIVWGLADALSAARRLPRLLGQIVAGAALICLIWISSMQVTYWSDSESIWKQAIQRTADNGYARINLANFYLENGRIDDAVQQCQEAVDISRSRIARKAALIVTQQMYADAENNLGLALAAKGQTQDARAQFERVLARLPNDSKAHLNLGTLFLKQGRMVEATEHFTASLNAYPGNANAWSNLANALLRTGKIDEAIVKYERALQINPGLPDAENNLAVALFQKGLAQQAVMHWNKAIQLQPDRVDALNNLAWVLATSSDEGVRQGQKALRFSQRAIAIAGETPMNLRTLAAAYAEINDFTNAREIARRASESPALAQDPNLANALQSDLSLYSRGQPVRAVPQPGP